MPFEQTYVSAELGKVLDELSRERGGRVACVVIVCDDELEMIWPAQMPPETIGLVEDMIIEALVGRHRNEA